MSQLSIVLAALASALAAAVSSILQHHSARRAPDGRAHRLLRHLLTRPAWLIGGVAAVAGLALHILALDGGQLAVVQPLLISGLLFALPVSAVLERRRPSMREWLLALVLVAGLAMFLLAAKPTAGQVPIDSDRLAWSTVGGSVVVALLTGLGTRKGRLASRAAPAVLGLAAGVGYGLVAGLLKELTILVHTGVGNLFVTWPLYGLAALGVASVLLTQMAYRAGPLYRSMPALTVADPAASVIIGMVAFQERLDATALALLVQVVGFIVMAAAATQLARREASDAVHPVVVQPPL